MRATAGSRVQFAAISERALAPAAVLSYPFALAGAHGALAPAAGASPARLAAAAWLAAALACPALAAAMAARLAGARDASATSVRALRVALVAVAAPPLFTTLGVALYMAHAPVRDTSAWVAAWLPLLAIACLPAGRTGAAPRGARATPALRRAHAIVAAIVAASFLLFHLANHLAGLRGADAHSAIMKFGRHVYRASIVEPMLVGCFLFLVGSGLVLLWQRTARPAGTIRSLQMASGGYLAAFVLGHMNSVFVYARWSQHIDTGWAFATGAPAGLLVDAWNIRLVPHYAYGVFFALTHMLLGLRAAVASRGAARALAGGRLVAALVLAAAVALATLLGMCGVRAGSGRQAGARTDMQTMQPRDRRTPADVAVPNQSPGGHIT
jgi:hypothetical protein